MSSRGGWLTELPFRESSQRLATWKSWKGVWQIGRAKDNRGSCETVQPAVLLVASVETYFSSFPPPSRTLFLSASLPSSPLFIQFTYALVSRTANNTHGLLTSRRQSLLLHAFSKKITRQLIVPMLPFPGTFVELRVKICRLSPLSLLRAVHVVGVYVRNIGLLLNVVSLQRKILASISIIIFAKVI